MIEDFYTGARDIIKLDYEKSGHLRKEGLIERSLLGKFVQCKFSLLILFVSLKQNTLCNDAQTFCLLVVFVSLEYFSHMWRRHIYQWRTANFELWSVLRVVRVPFIWFIWILNTHTCCRKVLSGTATACPNKLGAAAGIWNPTFCMQGERSYRLLHSRSRTNT